MNEVPLVAASDSGSRQTDDAPPASIAPSPAELYLDLLKKCLTRTLFPDEHADNKGLVGHWVRVPVRRAFARFALGRVRHAPFRAEVRAIGGDWPAEAETMIGLRRLDNIQACMTDVLRRRIPGDVIETGVWRGGATIFMRAILAAYGEGTRTVWVADSFQGLPRPRPESYPADQCDRGFTFDELAVPLRVVRANFARYGLLDGQVRFLAGWFRETLPSAPIRELAVMRLDGDLYESTMDALQALYPRLSVGGYCIIDDYSNIAMCRQAVDDYRREHGITEPLRRVDWTAVFWQRHR